MCFTDKNTRIKPDIYGIALVRGVIHCLDSLCIYDLRSLPKIIFSLPPPPPPPPTIPQRLQWQTNVYVFTVYMVRLSKHLFICTLIYCNQLGLIRWGEGAPNLGPFTPSVRVCVDASGYATMSYMLLVQRGCLHHAFEMTLEYLRQNGYNIQSPFMTREFSSINANANARCKRASKDHSHQAFALPRGRSRYLVLRLKNRFTTQSTTNAWYLFFLQQKRSM